MDERATAGAPRAIGEGDGGAIGSPAGAASGNPAGAAGGNPAGDAMGGPPDIFAAAAAGMASRVSELLDRDAGLVREIGPDGNTPLHVAAHRGHDGVVRRLLRHGAAAMAIARNETGAQPLHAAAAGGHGAVIEQLLAHGAAIDARQANGWTALHVAAAAGDIETVRLLRERGARQLAAADGRKPRDIARERGHRALAKRLG